MKKLKSNKIKLSVKDKKRIEATIKKLESMQFSVGHPTNSVELLKKYSR